MTKMIDVHVHSTLNNSVQATVDIFKKVFSWTETERPLFLGLPEESKEMIDLLQNLKTIFYKQYFQGYAFAGFIHDLRLSDADAEKDFLKQAETFKTAGFDGVKMLEGKPSMRKIYKRLVSDPIYDPFYSFMEENKMPITLHNADPASFWHKSQLSANAIKEGWYCGDGISKDEMFEDVMNVMKKHPNLHLTLAHFGFTCDNISQAERFLGEYEYTMLDTTPGVKNFYDMLQNWEIWHAFFLRYQDRIKYGTDTSNYEAETDEELKRMAMRPHTLQRRFFEGTEPFVGDGFELSGVHLEEEVLKKIYYQNALREYGEPREINKAYVRQWLNEAKVTYGTNEKAICDLRFIEANMEM